MNIIIFRKITYNSAIFLERKYNKIHISEKSY